MANSSRETESVKPVVAGWAARMLPMLHVTPKRGRANRWGVILAGGDGNRLRDLTRFICGDDRPKQFCPLTGKDTLVEQTRIRAQRTIPEKQIIFPLTRSHREFYLQEPGIPATQRIVQPVNKGTAPAIVHSVLSIEENDPEAMIAILPCDHHYSNEPAFTAALESAFDIATEHSESVVLLGAAPEGPEVEYGWIEIGPPLGRERASFQVQGFCEKPSLSVANELLKRGSLWNTFVMVGHVQAFMKMTGLAVRDLVEQVRESRLWTGSETHIQDSVYSKIGSVDFSREVLSVQPRRLVALQMGPAGWSDLGHPERVVALFQGEDSPPRLQPRWIQEWLTPKRAAAKENAVALRFSATSS